MTHPELSPTLAQEWAIPRNLKYLLATLWFSVVVTMGLLVYWIWYSPSAKQKVAVVDLAQILAEEEERYAQVLAGSRPKSPEEWAKFNSMAQEFTKGLSRQLTAVSESCGCVLMHRAAVLSANAPDLTDVVRKGIRQ